MAFSYFSACCCSDKAENTSVQFDPNNERSGGYSNDPGSASLAAASPGRSILNDSSPPPPMPMRGDDYAGEYGSPVPWKGADAGNRSMPKDKNKEKARLQDLVKVFAKRATKGISCNFLNSTTGQVSPCRYFLENDLRELRVNVDGMPDMSCDISEVSDINTFRNDESCLPRNVVPMLSDSMKSKLIVIQHRDNYILLLEASSEDADTFFTSMRVLRLYCQQQDYVRANGRA